jgi:hypothetical protein
MTFSDLIIAAVDSLDDIRDHALNAGATFGDPSLIDQYGFPSTQFSLDKTEETILYVLKMIREAKGCIE